MIFRRRLEVVTLTEPSRTTADLLLDEARRADETRQTQPRRKLVVDPNLLTTATGSRRTTERARRRMLDDYKAGRVELSPVYKASAEAAGELRAGA